MLEFLLLTRSKTLNRLYVNYPYPMLVGLSALLIAFWTSVLNAIGSPVGVIVTVDALYLLLMFFVVWSAPARAMRDALCSLNDLCDPYPMLALCETLLRRRCSTKRRLDVTLNYCMALDMVGEHQKAYDLLVSFSMEAMDKISPMQTIRYYAILSGACISLDKKEQAVAHCERVLALCEAVPEQQQQEALRLITAFARVGLAYLTGDYEACLAHLKHAEYPTLLIEMSYEWLCANTSLALGDVQTAKNKLCKIVREGYRLHLVDKAKELLKTIEE